MPRSKSPAARGKASPRSRRSASPSSGRVTRGKKGAALVALPFADYAPKATVRDDLRVLSSMWFGKIAGESHQDKLESFYKNQAELYDGYRQRMLHARPPMMSNLMVQPERKGKVVWVDLGGGTGANVEYMRDAITEGWFEKIVVLDLTPSLCAVAIKRAAERYSDVMEVICGDACDMTDKRLPPAGTVDLVTFSYALVMIPDWRAAVANALRLLRPGGHLCVCDFTLLPEQGQWGLAQQFWRRVFAQDHVHLSVEHRAHLKRETEEAFEVTGFGALPYVPPFLRAGWYAYVGRKR